MQNNLVRKLKTLKHERKKALKHKNFKVFERIKTEQKEAQKWINY